TRMIHRQLAYRIGGRALSQPAPARSRALLSVLPILAAVLFAGLGIAGFVVDRANVADHNTDLLKYADPYSSSFDPTKLFGVRLGWLGILAIMGLGIAIGYLAVRGFLALQGFQAGARLAQDAVDLPSLGTNALAYLSWTATVERLSKGTVGVGKNFS